MHEAKMTVMSKEDSNIISLFKDEKNKSKAFELLVDQYQKTLYFYIRRMVLDHDDTDDVLQNTFIKAWKGLNNFRGESKILTWLYRIATNESLTFLKKKGRYKNVAFEDVQHQVHKDLMADTYYNGDEIQAKLHAALTTLPEKQKAVFVMKYYEDKKYDEISEITGTSVGALKASYHHAVNKIEKYLKKG